MFNPRLIIALIGLASTANAALWSVPPTNNTNKTTAPASKVLSPDEFTKRVNSLNEQNQAGLTNQVQQLLSKQPPAPALPPPPAPLAKTPAATIPPVDESDKNPPPETVAPKSAPTPKNSDETASQAAAPPAPLPVQNQNYSGFIGANTAPSTTNKNGTQKSNSGWSVKY